MLSPRSTSIVKFAFNSKDRTEIKSGLIVMILNFMALFLKRIPKLKNFKSVRTKHYTQIVVAHGRNSSFNYDPRSFPSSVSMYSSMFHFHFLYYIKFSKNV